MAHRQQAKSWERRAATSLARVWQQQGTRLEAHALLASVYGWFIEGFETADLQDAHARLEALAGSTAVHTSRSRSGRRGGRGWTSRTS
jgi:predicted ATPase